MSVTECGASLAGGKTHETVAPIDAERDSGLNPPSVTLTARGGVLASLSGPPATSVLTIAIAAPLAPTLSRCRVRRIVGPPSHKGYIGMLAPERP
jgi:hypothetical protein